MSGPKMKTLKDNKVPLTDEERAEVLKSKATWNHGSGGKPSPAVWKAVVNGKTWYVTNTHRAFQSAPTLRGAISKYHKFIKSTASVVPVCSTNIGASSMNKNEILSEKEANVVIANLRESGLTAKVTRVDVDGYIVKSQTSTKTVDPAKGKQVSDSFKNAFGSDDMDDEDEMDVESMDEGDEDEEMDVDSSDDGDEDEMDVDSSDDGDEDEMDEDDEAEGVLSSKEANIKIQAYNECGHDAKVTKVGANKFVVTAVTPEGDGGTKTYEDKQGDTFQSTPGKEVMDKDKNLGTDQLTLDDFKGDSNPNVKGEMTEAQLKSECRRLGVAYQ